MDSIEKMRKLNALTKELKQHGFAESSFEAIQQANQIYGDDDINADVRHGMIRSGVQERITKKVGDTTMEQTANESALSDMDKKLTKLSINLESLTGKMNEIIKAINDMDTRINAIKNRPERIVERAIDRPAPSTEQKESQVHDEKTGSAASAAQTPGEPIHDEYSVNQRVGNFKPTDVAIDKMFYFGKK